jgi:putative ABC transport system permease protein
MLPDAQVTDYRETNPALTQGLDQATSLLSLMSLVALVLGAVGVAMAMRAHLRQRLDTIAIMKSLGARSSQIMKIYLLQTLLLGLAGGVLGVLFGAGVQLAFPLVLPKTINIPTDFLIQPRAIAVGLFAGVLTTLLFTLPPLLDIRSVRPSLILRRDTESEGSAETVGIFTHFVGRLPWLLIAFIVTLFSVRIVQHRWPGHGLALMLEAVCLFAAAAFGPWLAIKARKNPWQIGAFLLILGGLAVIATALSETPLAPDAPRVGEVFSVGLVLVLLILLGASAGVLAALKFFLNHTRLHLPSSLRHGLANLYRPGNPSAALLAALGMGVMQIMTVFLVQQAVVSQLHITAAPNLPNVFLVDIANSEIDGMRKLLKAQPGITAEPELVPLAASRIEAINGVPAATANLRNFSRRMHLVRCTARRHQGGRRSLVEARRIQAPGGHLAAHGRTPRRHRRFHHHLRGPGLAYRRDRRRTHQRQRTTCILARRLHPAARVAQLAPHHLGRRRSRRSGQGQPAPARALSGVPHRHHHQRRADH